MKKSIKQYLFILILTLFTIVEAKAWAKNGHRIIGEIAQRHLSKTANKRIKELLGGESIAIASNWADFIKSNPTYNYLNNWHFLNLPTGIKPDSVRAISINDTTANVYNKINLMIADLKNPNTSDDQKAMSLKLLIHFFGDVHQPMHVSHKEDQGGNKIPLMWFNEKTNLHRLWDEDLIQFQELSYTEYCDDLDRASSEQISEWQSASLEDIIIESFTIAEKLYVGVQPNEKLMYKYNYDHKAILDAQLLKGGIRLAKVLEDIF